MAADISVSVVFFLCFMAFIFLLALTIFHLYRNLQSNGLVGKLPPELGNLEYLEELRLDRNKLGGILPATSSDSISDTRGM